MLKAFHGGRNQRHVTVGGRLVIADMAAGETSDVERVEYGSDYATLGGDEGIVAAGVELSTWTDPRTAPYPGYDIEIIAQNETGFWARVTRWTTGGYGYDYGYGSAEADFVWDWAVRGELA